MSNKDKITYLNPEDLNMNQKNSVKRTKVSKELIKQSLEEFGPVRSGAIDEDNNILAGNGTLSVGIEEGTIKKIMVVEADDDTYVMVRKSNMTEEEKIRYGIIDNSSAKATVFNEESINFYLKNGTNLENLGIDKLLSPKKDNKEPAKEADYPDSELVYYVMVEFDNSDQQLLVKSMLEDEGYKVFVYENNRPVQNR